MKQKSTIYCQCQRGVGFCVHAVYFYICSVFDIELSKSKNKRKGEFPKSSG